MKTTRLSILDLLSLGLVGLRVRRTRAALSALGIAIGIATMVVVVGIPASSQQALMRELAAPGTNLLQASALPDQTGRWRSTSTPPKWPRGSHR